MCEGVKGFLVMIYFSNIIIIISKLFNAAYQFQEEALCAKTQKCANPACIRQLEIVYSISSRNKEDQSGKQGIRWKR
jgi:hypothetical protein